MNLENIDIHIDRDNLEIININIDEEIFQKTESIGIWHIEQG